MTVIQIKVKPNSRASRLEQQEDGTWLAQLKSPPVDGKANEELIAHREALQAFQIRCLDQIGRFQPSQAGSDQRLISSELFPHESVLDD